MTGRVLRSAAISAMVIGVLLPFWPLLVWSVSRTWRYPALWPQELGLRAAAGIADPGSAVLSAVMTSAAIATAVALIAGAIGLAAGRALGMQRFAGRRIVLALLVAPVLVPTLAVSLGIQVVFIRYGLADTAFGVVLAHLIPATPYVTLVMTAAYARFDPVVEQQARTLGATPRQVFVHVTLPALLPALVVAVLLAFVISWNEYVLTLLIGGGTVRTLPLVLFAAIGSSDTALAAGLALVVSAPPLLLVATAARLLTPRPTAARRAGTPSAAALAVGGT